MATERQARRARDLHQDKLMSCGAHALSVEPLQGEAGGEAKSFGVVAWVQHKPRKKRASIPQILKIKEKGRTLKVPLMVRESKPFQLE